MNYYLSPYERDNEDLPQMINLNSIFHVCIFLKKIIYSTYVLRFPRKDANYFAHVLFQLR